MYFRYLTSFLHAEPKLYIGLPFAGLSWAKSGREWEPSTVDMSYYVFQLYSRCYVYNSQTTLNAKVRHSQPDYDRLPIFKKKKRKKKEKNPSRTHQAWGVVGAKPVSQSTNERVASLIRRRHCAPPRGDLLPMDFQVHVMIWCAGGGYVIETPLSLQCTLLHRVVISMGAMVVAARIHTIVSTFFSYHQIVFKREL